MKPDQIQTQIEAGLPGSRAVVRSDDDTHFEAVVVSEEFQGKRLIQRHQIVNRALGSQMGNEIHALSMKTLTPEERSALCG